MSKKDKCHVCSNGTGTSTCFACLLGLTGEYNSKRYKKLVSLGLIEDGEMRTMNREWNINDWKEQS